MKVGKIIGLDLGTKTLGIAISDSLHIIAYGYETFRFNYENYPMAINRVMEIIEKENIVEVAIGLPLHMNGDIGDRAKTSIKFRDDLSSLKPDLKIELIDERMSTMLATSRLLEADVSRKKRKEVIDKMAAVVILETYLGKRK